jgi:colanic acid/amylovoran biosynthesis glycosyltransferase
MTTHLQDRPLTNGTPARLAYVAKMFPRFSETFILNELLELERMGFEITVYSLKHPVPGPTHPQLQRLRARIVHLPERPVHWLTRGALDAGRALVAAPGVTLRTLLYVATRGTHQAWKRFFQASAMAADLAHRPVQHIHAHFASAPSRVAWFASRLSGVPFSFTAHAKDIYQQGTDYDLLRDKIAAASFVVTVSDYNRDHLTRIAGDGSRIRRLYNGVDLSIFTPRPISGERLTVLAVGRLVEKKGFDVLVRAWPSVLAGCPEAHLVVVGSGPQESGLRALARELGLHDSVVWRGPRTQHELRDELAAAHVFCLPCRVAEDGNRDGLPTVLLEAMAAGLPCVSTRIAGIPEIVRDQCEGHLVAPDDPGVLADALLALLRDPGRRAVLGARARQRAERLFDLSRNVGELAAWFRER